jgi:hypothetical protein
MLLFIAIYSTALHTSLQSHRANAWQESLAHDRSQLEIIVIITQQRAAACRNSKLLHQVCCCSLFATGFRVEVSYA